MQSDWVISCLQSIGCLQLWIASWFSEYEALHADNCLVSEGLLLTVGPSHRGLPLQFQTLCCSYPSFWIKGPSPSTWWIPAHPSRFSSYFLLQAFPGIFPTPTSLQRNSFFYVLLNILYTCHISLYQETVHCFRAGAVYLKSSKSSGRAR